MFKIKSKNKNGRGIIQILANGSLGSLGIVLYHFTNFDLFYVVGLISIAGCLIDSVSSDIGSLSKHNPVNIIGFKKMEDKLSGGISLLGSVAALIVSITLAIYITLIKSYDIIYFIIILLLIYSQTIIDSIFGSLLQVKYKCGVCGIVTEDITHCNEKTLYFSGVKFINNNMVNIISALVVFGLSLLVLGLI